jgi:hypothetical protein
MAKVDPYHTVLPERPPERDVYHNRSECPAGKQIKPEHWRAGTAQRPLCKDCQKLA